MEDGAFRRERLQSAVDQLRKRLEEVRASEEDQRRREYYDMVKAERDQLAAELASFYPDMAERLSELMARMAANDQQVEAINRALPRDKERLLVAELVARGLGGFRVGGLYDVPRITQQLRLPACVHDIHNPYAWPKTGG